MVAVAVIKEGMGDGNRKKALVDSALVSVLCDQYVCVCSDIPVPHFSYLYQHKSSKTFKDSLSYTQFLREQQCIFLMLSLAY